MKLDCQVPLVNPVSPETPDLPVSMDPVDHPETMGPKEPLASE